MISEPEPGKAPYEINIAKGVSAAQPTASEAKGPSTSARRDPSMLSPEMSRYLRHIELIQQAPRCEHMKANGVRCGSPALRGKQFCYFHHRLRIPKTRTQLPPLEDANAIQCAIMQIADAVLRKELDRATANTLLYALQTAAGNLKRVKFEPGVLAFAGNEIGVGF